MIYFWIFWLPLMAFCAGYNVGQRRDYAAILFMSAVFISLAGAFVTALMG